MTSSRNEILRLQRAFRIVLNSMARPGTVTRMPLPAIETARYPGVSSSLATLIDLFVDQATSFSLARDIVGDELKEDGDICRAENALVRAVAAETHARVQPVDKAAFVIVSRIADGACTEQAIARVSGGSLESPELGATAFIECGAISSRDDDADDLTWVSVEGPGVKNAHVFGIDRIDWAWARNRRDDEFPCGIDIVLTDPQGKTVAVPRTSFISVLAGRGVK